jgi:hypothetical protein
MKKLLLLGLVAVGISAAAVPAQAGGFWIGLNIGLPCPPVCVAPPPPVCLPPPPVVYGGCVRPVVYPGYYRERCWPGEFRRERYGRQFERERFERQRHHR